MSDETEIKTAQKNKYFFTTYYSANSRKLENDFLSFLSIGHWMKKNTTKVHCCHFSPSLSFEIFNEFQESTEKFIIWNRIYFFDPKMSENNTKRISDLSKMIRRRPAMRDFSNFKWINKISENGNKFIKNIRKIKRKL